VPFLLVPQILLAGVIVRFDKLHYRFDSQYSVPVTGDMMASRWAYEALAVIQFKNNKYQKDLFETEQWQSNVSYDLQFLVPSLKQELDDAAGLYSIDPGDPQLKESLELIRSGFSSIWLTRPYPRAGEFRGEGFSPALAADAYKWLEKYRRALDEQRRRLSSEMDLLVDSLKNAAGGLDAYQQLRRVYDNEQLASLVLNRSDLHKIIQKEGKFIRKMDPIYMMPVQKNGRAHQYSAVKQIGNLVIPTYIFNISVLWTMSILLYLALRYSLMRKTVDYFADRKLKR